MKRRVLVLAGSSEARTLCDALSTRTDTTPIASLAGVAAAAPYPCQTRIGGFGGDQGLADYLQTHRIDALIDATHAFATQISRNAAIAAAAARLPLLRLLREPWSQNETVAWTEVDTLDAAAAELPTGARAFLAVGLRSLPPFCARGDLWRAARVIAPPDGPPPFSPGQWVRGRPPFSAAEEAALFSELKISHLVCKNAGGEDGWAKLAAAAAADIEILMVRRPAPANADCPPQVATTRAAVAWLDQQFQNTA